MVRAGPFKRLVRKAKIFAMAKVSCTLASYVYNGNSLSR